MYESWDLQLSGCRHMKVNRNASEELFWYTKPKKGEVKKGWLLVVDVLLSWFSVSQYNAEVLI